MSVPVHASMFEYILFMSFHCQVCTGTYWYILVQTGAWHYYMLHIRPWKVDSAKT
jgi:hypothetical protein